MPYAYDSSALAILILNSTNMLALGYTVWGDHIGCGKIFEERFFGIWVKR